ncbi:hypothetical protein L3Q82_024468 [Scortum barcoo]|uniref:Uncharacterized protein n=1 Tax=Scortum barcoo TaxID=214431 RepID=A0ACB8WRJ0_9TELE|nr:hypothetical protein L3Q82_024468 [Scortum barcoo]
MPKSGPVAFLAFDLLQLRSHLIHYQDQEPGPAQVWQASIRALVEANQTLSNQVSTITSQLASLLALQASSSPLEPEGEPPWDIHSAPPEPFKLRPLSFTTNISKIHYILGLLRGKALTWAEARFARGTREGVSYCEFLEEIKLVFALRIDARLQACCRERHARPVPSAPRFLSAEPLWASSDSAADAPETTPREEPMQVGRARLTSEERNRLCLWSDQPLLACLPMEAKRSGPPVSMGVLAGHVQDPSCRRPRFQLQATVCYQLQHLPLQVLVDSGAEENLLDLQVANQAGIPFEVVEKPHNTLAVDGRVMAHVTHRTQSLTLVVSGNQSEKIQLLLISAPNTPGGEIIGLEHQMLIRSCLRSALSPGAGRPMWQPQRRRIYLAFWRSITI